MQIANVQQDAAWNGPEGHHWAARAESINADLTDRLLAAADIAPTHRVLDVGCGTGGSTRAAARLAVDGAAVGLDLSEPMLARAAALAQREGLTNVRFERGDAQVHRFPAGRFDVAISQFGIMFFADPVAAFANIRLALRPGGRLVFVCPQAADDCEWYRVPIRALDPSGSESPTPNEGMFSLADPGVIRDVLGKAGFARVRATAVTASVRFGRDLPEAVDFFAGSGPVRAVLESGALTEDAVRATLGSALHPYVSPTGILVPGRHWIVEAM
ncbi:methyltransferase [Virgisporangium aliadipatigenens]|uniref:Methyltransferase n=1 Tax=Virgisporangium aliadipatigenens TaxID=741659 RepID=A0A8J3YMN6_9ACTN|nr:class I SAM-dependent methyltransferase [Virgisporangium aliadipatigenens]GIJ48061.1 methyltransferase [Virgisporangium aliadipatigenens]